MASPGQKLEFVGIFIPLVFWLTLAVCGELLGGYRHGSDLVSELGAEGTAAGPVSWPETAIHARRVVGLVHLSQRGVFWHHGVGSGAFDSMDIEILRKTTT